MITIVFCDHFSNPVFCHEVTEALRVTSSFFLPTRLVEEIDKRTSMSKEELLKLINEDDVKGINEKTYFTVVLKVKRPFCRRIPDEIRSRYFNGGGPMTISHIGVELEAYKRAKRGNIPCKVDDQECPLHQRGLCNACNKYIAKSPGIVNITDLYPHAEFEPRRNLTSRLRSDIKLVSQDYTREAAIEADNTSDDTKKKIFQGYPILVLKAKTQKDVEYVKSTKIFDTTNGDCIIENGWALPFMLCQFGCNNVLEKYRALYHEKSRAKTKTKTQEKQEEGKIKHYSHGLSPETKLPGGKFKGEPLDYVMDVDRAGVIWTREKNPTLYYILTPYARTYYGLKTTEIELLLDQCIDELDRIVDVGPYIGKTVEEVAKKDFNNIIWLQHKCNEWEGRRLSEECMNYLARMYCRKKK